MDFIIDNVELLIAILSLVIALIALFSLRKRSKILISVISLLLSLVFIGLYCYSWQTVTVPYVEDTMYSTAQALLRQVGLREQIVSYNGGVIGDTDFRIGRQSPEASERVQKGTTVILYVKELGKDDFVTDGRVPSVNDSASNVRITIDEYSIFSEGYRYEWIDDNSPNTVSLIEFEKGIYGTFSYSRDLTEPELDGWGHSGNLYTSEGTIVDEKNNHPNFWCMSDGRFAVEFPMGLGRGKYIYELIVWINDVQISDSIEFVVE